MPNEIFLRWGHSFEEDAGDVTVYRPGGYPFPRARGRAGIEFKPDGTFIEWIVGPADAREPVRGQWRMESPGRVRVSFESDLRPQYVLEILQCDAEVLKVRQHAAS